MVAGDSREAAPDRGARLILAAALALGLVRFARLSEWSLWFDEVATWTDVHHGLEGGQITNPIGYRAIALVVRLLGLPPDELSLRLLPAVAGWCAIPLAFLVFRPIAGARRAAACALLLAASPWHVAWSQTARFYTLALDASLLGAGLCLQGIAAGKLVRTGAGLAIAALAASLHPSALLLLPALVLAPWAARALGRPLPPSAKRPAALLLALAVVVAAISASWAVDTWRTYVHQKGMEEGARLASIAHYLKTTGYHVTPALVAGALFGACTAWRRRDGALVAAVAVAALVLAEALVAAAFVKISAQYVFVALPWIALAASVPLAPSARIGEPAPARDPLAGELRTGLLLLLVVPLLATTALYFTARGGERPRWREAYDYVWNQRGADDLVLGMEASVGELYAAPHETSLREAHRVAWLDYFRAGEPERWAPHARRTWYVFGFEQLDDWGPELRERFLRFLRAECRLAAAFPLDVEGRDLSVWVYVRG